MIAWDIRWYMSLNGKRRPSLRYVYRRLYVAMLQWIWAKREKNRKTLDSLMALISLFQPGQEMTSKGIVIRVLIGSEVLLMICTFLDPVTVMWSDLIYLEWDCCRCERATTVKSNVGKWWCGWSIQAHSLIAIPLPATYLVIIELPQQRATTNHVWLSDIVDLENISIIDNHDIVKKVMMTVIFVYNINNIYILLENTHDRQCWQENHN